MAALYADEQFPKAVAEKLRSSNHDVLTVQEAARQGDSDEKVLAFAAQQERIVLTINRRDFIRLHRQDPDHAGIVVCKQDHDWQRLAANVNRVLTDSESLKGKLLRVRRE